MTTLQRLIFITAFFVSSIFSRADEWHHYLPFAGVEQMAETNGRVYFTSAGSLFAYDKDNDETISLSTENGLHDAGVAGIFSSPSSGFVVVVFSNGNIDLIRDNGKVINLPDIKDSEIADKTVNNISFNADGTSMLVATNFGIIRYDLKKMEVIDSGIYGFPVYKVGFLSGIPTIYLEDGRMLLLTAGASIRDLLTWKHLADLAVIQFQNSGEKLYGLLWIDGLRRPVEFRYDSGSEEFGYKILGTGEAESLLPGNTLTPITAFSNGSLTAFDTDGKISASVVIPSELSPTALTVAEGLGNFWIGNKSGIANADGLSGKIYISETISPGNMSVRKPHILRMAPSGNLYVGNRGNSNVFYEMNTGFRGYQAMVTQEGEITNLTPENLSAPHFHSPSDKEDVIYDALFIREDAENPTIYYTGDLYSGFYALSNIDGRELVHYSPENSPLTDYWGVRVMDVITDPQGYMWVLSERDPGLPSLMVLSPEGRAKGSAVTKDDWTVIKQSSVLYAGRDGKLEMSPDGRYIYAMGANDLFVYDTKGTPDFSDDTGNHVVNFRMYDGSGYSNYDRFCDIAVNPHDGALWVATYEGVFKAPQPSDVANGAIEIIKPKVSRNDGSGLADYLLSTEKVYSIAFDAAGHIWFTTDNSGVFLTSSDGTEILKNFTRLNSPLPSNTVYSVQCDVKGSDKVYFGTPEGLMLYRSGYTAPREDYNEVKIYPNPVRPDYFGEITIEGLVDGSTVKILSASGALVATLKSQGGTVKWDGLSGGRRLPSGVYHVLASSERHSGKPVGKIVIVR